MTRTRKVKYYKTVRSALEHNLNEDIRYNGYIYSGLGWLMHACTSLSIHKDEPCKLVLAYPHRDPDYRALLWDIKVVK